MPVKLIPTDYDPEHPPVEPVLRDDTKFASGKMAFFQYVVVGVFVFLLSGFWKLQIQNPDYYSGRAERNRIRSQPLVAPRGKILDRDGRVIVDSRASFSLLLSRENLAERSANLRFVAEGLHLDYNELLSRLRVFDKTRPKYDPIFIKQDLSPAEIAFVEAHRGDEAFPEMELIPVQRRLYPRGGLAAHIVGYTGEINEKELNTAAFARYRQGDIIGKDGVEREYNDILMGVDGQRRVIVDNLNRFQQVIDNKPAVSGKNLQLTIDLDLQAVAELAMEGRRGAVVALDPRTGEVLAMLSHPTYDPNKFTGGMSKAEADEIFNNPESPLLNRATKSHFAPGSTFKPFVAMAALAAGVIDASTTFHCAGGATFYGNYRKCHAVHGTVNLHDALRQSCDVYFYNVGDRVGVDKIAEFAEMAGLGSATGIDLPSEEKGIVPSTRWKVRTQRDKWYSGETISVAIGQGALVVTPVQLASAIGGLARGGVWYQPHLVKEPEVVPQPEPHRANLNKDDLNLVLDGMCAVVNEPGGTGTTAHLPDVQVCGKTGSSQLISNELAKSGKVGSMPDNAWFVAFAPRENPEIVISVLWEGGLHGTLAAPVARDILKAYFDKKARTGPRPLVASRQMGEQ